MAIAVNLASLINGSYVERIQDALGYSGATATITTGSQGTIQITGSPTGEGLQIEAKAVEASTSSTPAASDTVSLSPAAQAALNRQQIALTLLDNGGKKAGDKTESQQPSQNVAKSDSTNDSQQALQNAPAGGQSSSSPNAVDATDVVALSQEDPTQLIKDLVGAAETEGADISTTSGFQAAATANPSFLQSFAQSLPDNLGGSFLTAFAQGTLNVQSGQDAGWDVGGGLTLTGTSMTGVSGADPGKFDTSATNVVCAGIGFVPVVFSWPKTDS